MGDNRESNLQENINAHVHHQNGQVQENQVQENLGQMNVLHQNDIVLGHEMNIMNNQIRGVNAYAVNGRPQAAGLRHRSSNTN